MMMREERRRVRATRPTAPSASQTRPPDDGPGARVTEQPLSPPGSGGVGSVAPSALASATGAGGLGGQLAEASCVQPLVGSHVSSVHALPSSQSPQLVHEDAPAAA